MIRAVAGLLWNALDWLFPRATGRMDIDMTRLTEDEPKPPKQWDEEGMDLHIATAILQPDSQLLPAEEA